MHTPSHNSTRGEAKAKCAPQTNRANAKMDRCRIRCGVETAGQLTRVFISLRCLSVSPYFCILSRGTKSCSCSRVPCHQEQNERKEFQSQASLTIEEPHWSGSSGLTKRARTSGGIDMCIAISITVAIAVGYFVYNYTRKSTAAGAQHALCKSLCIAAQHNGIRCTAVVSCFAKGAGAGAHMHA